jgi:hypothetical protein
LREARGELDDRRVLGTNARLIECAVNDGEGVGDLRNSRCRLQRFALQVGEDRGRLGVRCLKRRGAVDDVAERIGVFAVRVQQARDGDLRAFEFLVVVEGLFRNEAEARRSGEYAEPPPRRAGQLAEDGRLASSFRVRLTDLALQPVLGCCKLIERAAETGNDRLSVRTRNEANEELLFSLRQWWGFRCRCWRKKRGRSSRRRSRR